MAEHHDGLVGERIPVRFEGHGTGSGGLSWGQREIWQEIRNKDWWLPIGVVLPLPADTTVEQAVNDLRFVMAGYPSMRTRLNFSNGDPLQVVAGSGETALEVVDTGGDDPGTVANLVWRRYWRQPYDFTEDWPLRMAVIRHGGVLTHRVWIMCHLATDGGGGRVVIDELAGRDLSGSRAALPSIEQARWQRSPAGRRVSDVALGYWRRSLDRVPVRQPRAAGAGPRYWQGRLESPAMHLAALAIAARTGTGVSSVLLALFAVARARVTGTNPVAVQVTVGNRFRPGLARSVSPLMQNGLCVIDVPDGSVDQAVEHTRRRVMAAYKHGYYDPRQRDELIASVTETRSAELDIGCHFNDRRLKPRDESGPPPTAEQVRAALPESTFTWQYKQDKLVFDQHYFNVEDIPDRIMVTVTLDAHYVLPESAAECLREMESVAVAAALDPAAPTRVPSGS
jgi:condensation domain-containing protein